MPRVLGIDPSLTGTGLVVVEDDGQVPYEHAFGTKASMDMVGRLHTLSERALDIYRAHAPDLVVIEGLAFGQHSSAVTGLAGLHWLLRYRLYRELVCCPVVVPPTTLKKFVTGKGNSPKDVMMMKVLKRWRREYTDNNLCDAYCLARWGQAFLAGEVELPARKKRKKERGTK